MFLTEISKRNDVTRGKELSKIKNISILETRQSSGAIRDKGLTKRHKFEFIIRTNVSFGIFVYQKGNFNKS